MKGFRYIHSRVAEVWGHLIRTDRDLFSASVSGLKPQQAIRASSLTGSTTGASEAAQGGTCLLQALKIHCQEGSAASPPVPRSLSPQVQFESGQEPHECLHPDSFSSGEVLDHTCGGGHTAWSLSPCCLSCQAFLLVCSPSASPCTCLPPFSVQMGTILYWPTCTQTLLQGHLSW